MALSFKLIRANVIKEQGLSKDLGKKSIQKIQDFFDSYPSVDFLQMGRFLLYLII